jgi:DNA-directed RNA polymerase subunit RPC12/RpoP
MRSKKIYKCSNCGKLLEVVPKAENEKVIFVVMYHSCKEVKDEVEIVKPKSQTESIKHEYVAPYKVDCPDAVVESKEAAKKDPLSSAETELNSFLKNLEKSTTPAKEFDSPEQLNQVSKEEKLKLSSIAPTGILDAFKRGF